jgi:hypothetical protein
MCHILQVSSSGYYKWCRNTPGCQMSAQEVALVEIKAIHAEVKERYGSPRIHQELKKRGFKTSRMTSRLVVDALNMAIQRRMPGEGILTHSDRGSQYASDHYQRVLEKHGIQCSMSGVGQCWDNAPMESFFASLKKELVNHEDYETREEAKTSLFEYVEVFYNHKRIHSSLGYLTPSDYEQAL